jgi:hypothetical protein
VLPDLPREIRERKARESCALLGLKFEELTVDIVKQAENDLDRIISLIDEARKRKTCNPGECARMILAAFKTLHKWVKDNPGSGSDPYQPSGEPRKPSPLTGTTGIALPLPEPEKEEE